ncbi:MAG: WG repeat-containing protein [Dechloromonas sp.]|uniref:WG repeat-containing protein n=1 Tax=Candidatus Dechloromonas phosphorivorans TaxID=2899244 RepID=A0A935MWM6_9RHOO|nr:WG repeat-containing protein [Candidatus Dechloromonas phosphorivorans]
MVIKIQFDDTRDFHEGLAAVRIGDEKTGKWGFISR